MTNNEDTVPVPLNLLNEEQLIILASHLKDWAAELGFNQCGITDIHLEDHGKRLQAWLANGFHGDMHYMAQHGHKRFTPAELVPGTIRVISLRMDYWPESATEADYVLADPTLAFVSRYTLGRDYHKLLRKRLASLVKRLTATVSGSQYRVFTDSAPVMERALAEKAGLGWIGKNTMLINPKAGSFFFLGEIYTNLPLPVDPPFADEHCGTCRQCLDLCPTRAFVGPYVLDSRRCISYLTIELKGDIPEELRPLLGNRIFGCDDCQLVCPWNKFVRGSDESDFSSRHQLDQQQLISLFEWSEEKFLTKTAGSAIRRTGYVGWLRNIAVAIGNGPASETAISALALRESFPSPIVQNHVRWALMRLKARGKENSNGHLINTRNI